MSEQRSAREIVREMTTCGHRGADFERCSDCQKQAGAAIAALKEVTVPSMAELMRVCRNTPSAIEVHELLLKKWEDA